MNTRRQFCTFNTTTTEVCHCVVSQHAAGMPSSYRLGMMSPPPPQPPTQCPYPPATSPAMLSQYQYRAPPPQPHPAPVRATVPTPHCADYYIPVVHDQRSYPVSIPNCQPLPQQQPQPTCFTGIYDNRACPPTTLPGPGAFCLRNVLFDLILWVNNSVAESSHFSISCETDRDN